MLAASYRATRATLLWWLITAVSQHEHPDRLFDHNLGRHGDAFSTHHPGPKRELVEHPHELMGRQQRIMAVQKSERGYVREVAHEPLGLRLHDGGELLGDPRKLA